MDFIPQLSLSQGYNEIYIYVNRFMKMTHFIATNSNVMAEGTAELYLKDIFKSHRLSEDIILH